ncbi:MAG TPA: hypothetical protein DCF78_14835 [Dehalococcoidia bacterium]|nr:hypothetical protein [Dehalococcoidia bacterium]
MNYGGPDRQENRQKLLDAVDSVRETIITGAEQAEAEMTIPPASINALYDSGLFSLKLPEVLGGAEADPITQMEVLEALALYDSSASWCVMIGATSIGSPGAFLPDEGIQEVFRDGRIPRAAGVGAPTGQVTPVEGGYRVTGRWPFASGIRHSEWVGGGITIPNDDAAPEIRRALFPTSEVKIHDNWDVMGLRGTGSCDFSVSDVFVPSRRIFRADVAPKRGGALYLMGHPGFVTNEHAGFALGVGRRALNAIVDLAETKSRGRGLNQSVIANRPSFQYKVGECDLRLRAARSLMIEILEESWDTACQGRNPDTRQQTEMRSCATYATEVALDAVTLAFRHGGGEVLEKSHDLQQCLRDMNAAAQHFMVSNSSYEAHGKFVLGQSDANAMR